MVRPKGFAAALKSYPPMLQLRFPQPGEPSYSSLRRTPGEGRPQSRSANAAPQAGPRQYEPSGKRYTIDRNAISYMGWTFQVCKPRAPIGYTADVC